MITRYDNAYRDLDSMPEDAADEMGRTLTQREVAIREHILDAAREVNDRRSTKLFEKAGKIREDARSDTQSGDPLAVQLYQVLEDIHDTDLAIALDGIKGAWLAGQREGLRFGVGLMLRVLTVKDAAGKLEPRAPEATELLTILKAMSDDETADLVILQEMGAKPDDGEDDSEDDE